MGLKGRLSASKPEYSFYAADASSCLDGNTLRKILVPRLSPSLITFGVSGVLAESLIDLYAPDGSMLSKPAADAVLFYRWRNDSYGLKTQKAERELQ